MASVTKIMTGLLAVENTFPTETVTISERAANTGEKEIGTGGGGDRLDGRLVQGAHDPFRE